jgi:hypothetical protein
MIAEKSLIFASRPRGESARRRLRSPIMDGSRPDGDASAQKKSRRADRPGAAAGDLKASRQRAGRKDWHINRKRRRASPNAAVKFTDSGVGKAASRFARCSPGRWIPE